MQIFDPIAGVYFNPLAVIALGIFAGLTAGMVGLGGGLIVVPSMILYGVAPNVAAATANCYMVSTASSGLSAYLTRRLVDVKTGFHLMCGSLLGGLAGVTVVGDLLEGGWADDVIRGCFAGIAGLIGLFMVLEAAGKGRGDGADGQDLATGPRRFHSLTVPIGILAGLTSSVLGIAGGVFIVPFLIYGRGFETRRAVGTSLMLILFTTAGVSVLHSLQNRNMDILLAGFLMAGSGAGAQLGARLSKKTGPRIVKLVFAVIALAVAARLGFPSLAGPVHHPGSPPASHGILKILEAHSLVYGLASVCLALAVGLLWGKIFQRFRPV